MSRTATRPTSTAPAALVALLALVTTLLAPAPARAAVGPDTPWLGFPIAVDASASGAWIGGRTVANARVYRVDPAARARTGGYGPVREVGRLRATAAKWGASREETARAAWILSKYGDYPDPVQAAAVDAAVLHLLARHEYRLGRSLGRARLAATGEAATVRSFARTMLAGSRRSAGPYTVRAVQTGRTVRGGLVQVAVSVTSDRTGTPLASVPVVVSSWAGRTVVGDTDDAGRATVAIRSSAAGARPLEVRVRRTPLSHLLLRSPERTKASRAAVSGVKRTLRAGLTAYVLAVPRVRVTTRDARVRAPGTLRARFRVTGSSPAARRAVRVSLHGPFRTRAAATCERRTLRRTTKAVAGDGVRRLPRWPVGRAGWYVWEVEVTGDRVNLPAAHCAGRTRVLRRR